MGQFFTVITDKTNVELRVKDEITAFAQISSCRDPRVDENTLISALDDWSFDYEVKGDKITISGWGEKYYDQDLSIAGFTKDIKGMIMFLTEEGETWLNYYGSYGNPFTKQVKLDVMKGLESQLKDLKKEEIKFLETTKKLNDLKKYNDCTNPDFLKGFESLELTKEELLRVLIVSETHQIVSSELKDHPKLQDQYNNDYAFVSEAMGTFIQDKWKNYKKVSSKSI